MPAHIIKHCTYAHTPINSVKTISRHAYRALLITLCIDYQRARIGHHVYTLVMRLANQRPAIDDIIISILSSTNQRPDTGHVTNIHCVQLIRDRDLRHV